MFYGFPYLVPLKLKHIYINITNGACSYKLLKELALVASRYGNSFEHRFNQEKGLFDQFNTNRDCFQASAPILLWRNLMPEAIKLIDI